MPENQTKPDVLPDIALDLSNEVVEAIDVFRSDADIAPEMNREEAIRRILRDWLIGHGYLKP